MALLIHRVEILKPQSNCREQVSMTGIWSQRSMKRGPMPPICLQPVTALFKGGDYAVGTVASKGMDRLGTLLSNLVVKKKWIPASAWRTIRSELTAASTPDQVHARQMMNGVHTVSIVPKNKYAG
jgi:hypothetical protein